MADLVLLCPRAAEEPSAAAVLPGLALLPHRTSVLGPDPAVLLSRPAPDLVLVDARHDLLQARTTLRTLAAMGLGHPVLAVVDEGALAVVDEQWPMDDLLLVGASPAEVGARLRLALARASGAADRAVEARSGPEHPVTVQVADVVVDEAAWTVRAGGRLLDLTFKEFELLRYLVGHPDRVLSRATLLQQVWGADYYGGTRTVDVHVRRLRAKLGPERESLIGTIRGVGYRFSGPRTPPR